MGVGAALSRVWTAIARAVEGEYRPGPWRLPVSGSSLSVGAPSYGEYWNWWQLGGNPIGRSRQSAMVEACVSAYAQTVSMCPGDHWWRNDETNGRERVRTSALSRVLRHPNVYQTMSDFLLNAVRSLYLDGNAYALALRNDRFEIDELHLMDPNQSSPQVSTSGDVFYRLGGNTVIDYRLRNEDNRDLNTQQLLVPARDVLHIRLNCYERTAWPFPLVGQTPLEAALGDLETIEGIKNQQQQFYQNQARPSAVLTTDLTLDKDQVQALRDRWNEQAKGLHAGGVPILTGGLKVMPWAHTIARDAQTAEMMKMSEDRIALVFRVPLQILGIQSASGFSIEQLMGFWLASGLGFCLNHVEEAFGHLYGLKGWPDEYVEFDTEALLRSARKDRIDALARAVQGGIYAPNEARAREDLPKVPYGDEPRVQQQVVPLSAAAGIPGAGGADSSSGPPIKPAPAAPAQPSAEGLAASSYDEDLMRKRLHRSLMNAADAAAHRDRSAA